MSGPPPPPPGFVLDSDGAPPPPPGFQRSAKIRETELRQGKPESAWHSAWESVRNSIFGTPERAEALASGDLTSSTPTTADLANYAMVVGSMGGTAAIGGAVRGAAESAAGPLGRAASWVIGHPKATGAMIDAAPDLLQGNMKGAAYNALEGAALGAAAQGGGKIVKRLRGGGGLRDAVRAVVGEAEAVAPASGEETLRQAKALIAAGKNEEARALIDAARLAPPAAAVPAAVVPRPVKVDRGKVAAASHDKLMSFAKDIAKENPKVGQKIWILLDDAGQPVRMLTPDQAGAAARKGQKTTWVKNLWTSSL